MPKVSSRGKFCSGGAAKVQLGGANVSFKGMNPVSEQGEASSENVQSKTTQTRVSRKSQAQKDFYKKLESQYEQRLKEKEPPKPTLALDALKCVLLTSVQPTSGAADNKPTDSHKPKTNMLKSSKSRQRLLLHEAAQLAHVQQHPQFLVDPLATLRDHLTNTMAKDRKRTDREHQANAQQRQQEKEQRKAAKKEMSYKHCKRRAKRCKSTRSKNR